MAVRVDDAARTLARARALLCPEWQERIGAGERPIPAVRSPDGTLVYLVEPEAEGVNFWHDDFDLLQASGASAHLEQIDHVVQALPAGRMGTFVLFWRAVFGLAPQPLLETPDPYGLVQSRALVSPGGRLRLALNTSESRATATGRFVSAYAGAGVHQIALSTADIALAAERLEALAAPLLPMPANYYDDVSARFGLDDDMLAELQRHGLLYDRDGPGEFRHLYTDAFHDRFYFEVVERRGGYGGFGAANASVRAAAQMRQSASDGYFL
jgi:4-hydroxyphenylpyruvate dioxygenase